MSGRVEEIRARADAATYAVPLTRDEIDFLFETVGGFPYTDEISGRLYVKFGEWSQRLEEEAAGVPGGTAVARSEGRS